MICYWSERCMLWPSLWFVTGQNTMVWLYELLWSEHCYDQVYDLLLVRTLYVTTKFMICCWSECCMLRPSLWFVTGQNTVCYNKFMICYWSEHCIVWPSLWFVTGQNTVCYDQVYDLLLVRTLCYDQVYDLLPVKTLYVTTKLMICYWSKHCMLLPSLWFVTGQNTMLRPSLWFVTGQNTICYDQVYDLLLVSMLYVTTKFMICYFSERHMLR